MASTGPADTGPKEIVTKAEVVKTTKLEPSVSPPPRPGQEGFALPRDLEEWKAFLARAAPWVIAAVVVTAGVGALHKADTEGTGGLGLWARKKERRATNTARDAGESVRSGWFGLKRNAAAAGGEVKRNVQDAVATAKDGAVSTGSYVADKAGDLAEASRQAALRAESSATKAASKLGAVANQAEESTGRAIKDVGATLQRDGAKGKAKYIEAPVKPWWQLW